VFTFSSGQATDSGRSDQDLLLQAYIHPIVPVLNETRHIVKAYNRHFKERVLQRAKGRLRWLEFFDELLTDDQKSLRPEYELDGTHLHPSYLSLLVRALENCR
jgi:hypothetical protein